MSFGSLSVWNRLALVTPPPSGDAGMVVSLAQAKRQCRVAHGEDDEDISDLVISAQNLIDGPRGAGIALLTQRWRLSLDRWPLEDIVVPLGPVQSIDLVTYQDLTYVEHTLDPGQYVYDLDADPPRIRRAFGVVWPLIAVKPGAAKVTFTTGFGDTAAAVPADIKHAIKLLVSHWYEHRDAVVGVENRDSSTPLPLGVDAILDRYRTGRIA